MTDPTQEGRDRALDGALLAAISLAAQCGDQDALDALLRIQQARLRQSRKVEA